MGDGRFGVHEGSRRAIIRLGRGAGPCMLGEVASGLRIQGNVSSYLAIAYTAVLPSFVAYLFFNRGVELIGAGPAGQSMHLMPLFGSVLAVLFLHEQFEIYHVA